MVYKYVVAKGYAERDELAHTLKEMRAQGPVGRLVAKRIVATMHNIDPVDLLESVWEDSSKTSNLL